jgi:UDP-N-acetylglucosamine--N-acetylmuramyl-(pentapeptide) pyrophosphoryl-undecaprenol N-acetylglucosamine transferase
MRIVITGGHHSSALPVIKNLREKWPDTQIYWFGHKYSALGDKNPTLEFHEITTLNIPFYHIHAGKFYRTANLWRLAKIPFGLFQCLYLLIKLKPDAILSFGGYIAVPTVVAGWILGIPSITHEQTVVAGWANRLVSKFAKKVLVSWPQSQKFFPREKTVFVGLPLRKEIFEVKSQNFVIDNDLPTVYITTGKIGSHIINKVVGECLLDLLGFSNVIHQCGDNSVYNDFGSLTNIKDNMGVTRGKYYLQKFIFENEVGEAFSKSDLVVSRSGAHTTAELLALKKPCLLIPISWVSHNEQYENAKILVEAGLGTILAENKLSKESLLEGVKKAFENKAPHAVRLDGSGRNNESAELIVHHLISIIKKT